MPRSRSNKSLPATIVKLISGTRKVPAERATRASASSTPTVKAGTAAKRKVRSASFQALVKGGSLSGMHAVEAIRAGYSIDMLRSASEYLHLPISRVWQIMDVAPTTAKRLEKQSATLDRAASERVLRMAAILRMASQVFEDEQAAVEWLGTPNGSLGDSMPLDLLDTEPGADSVRLVLHAIEAGGVA